MGGVVLAVVTLVITFVIAGYGIYGNVEVAKRSMISSSIGHAIERQAKSVQDLALDFERLPTEAEVDVAVFQRDSSVNVTYSYRVIGTDGFVCATSDDPSELVVEAMNMLARTRPTSFVSGNCGTATVPVSARVAFSMKVI